MRTMSKIIACVFLVSAATPALADDWTGQTPPPPVNGSIGPYTTGLVRVELEVVCQPSNTPPPCAPGDTPTYQGKQSTATLLPAVPAAAAGPASGLGLQFAGVYADPTSPTGIAGLAGMLPLNAFASAARVDGIATNVNGLGTTVAGLSTSVNALNSTVGTLTTSFNALSATVGTLGTSLASLSTTVGGLSTQVNTLNASVGTLQTQMQSVSLHVGQIQQQLALQDRVLRQGVAMSLAMDGTGTLGPDENFAISMNLGTYGGQNGMAAGFAFRAAQHLTFNGGIGTGVNGGLVGGRAGVRLAW